MITHHKIVAALPPELLADAIYYVRAGEGFDLYVTNSSGTVVAYPGNQKAAPVATVTGMLESTTDSTADFDFLTLTTAQDVKVGAVFEAQMFGTQSQGAVSQSLLFYAKVNGGAAVTIGTVGAGASAQSYRAMSGKALVSFPTAGASGSYMLAGDFMINGLVPYSSNSASSRAADTRAGMTITLGIRCSVANALNINRVTGGFIKQIA